MDWKIADQTWQDHIKKLPIETLRAEGYIDRCFRCSKPDQPYRSYNYPTVEGNYCQPCFNIKMRQLED